MNQPYRTAQAESLGPAEQRYTSPPPVRAVLLMLLIFGLPGLALVTGFQSARGQIFAGEYTTNAAVGAGLLVLAVVFSGLAIRKSTLSVTLHENGLLWREKGHARAIPWGHITSMTGSHTLRRAVGADIARTDVYQLLLSDGTRLVMSNMLADVASLAARVEHAVDERVLTAARRDLAASRPVSFGPLLVTPEGAELRGRSIASPLRVAVEGGVISVHGRDGARLEVPWSEIPNPQALLSLLAERERRTNSS